MAWDLVTSAAIALATAVSLSRNSLFSTDSAVRLASAVAFIITKMKGVWVSANAMNLSADGIEKWEMDDLEVAIAEARAHDVHLNDFVDVENSMIPNEAHDRGSRAHTSQMLTSGTSAGKLSSHAEQAMRDEREIHLLQ